MRKKKKLVKFMLYAILMVADIYILGSVDFIEHKIWGVLFVVVNACLIEFIKYAGKDKK